jgi:hypothetical protein
MIPKTDYIIECYKLQAQNEKLKQELELYKEVEEDKKRLCRMIDVIMFGEEGAAKQPSLCDIAKSVSKLVRDNKDYLQSTLFLRKQVVMLKNMLNKESSNAYRNTI